MSNGNFYSVKLLWGEKFLKLREVISSLNSDDFVESDFPSWWQNLSFFLPNVFHRWKDVDGDIDVRTAVSIFAEKKLEKTRLSELSALMARPTYKVSMQETKWYKLVLNSPWKLFTCWLRRWSEIFSQWFLQKVSFCEWKKSPLSASLEFYSTRFSMELKKSTMWSSIFLRRENLLIESIMEKVQPQVPDETELEQKNDHWLDSLLFFFAHQDSNISMTVDEEISW